MMKYKYNYIIDNGTPMELTQQLGKLADWNESNTTGSLNATFLMLKYDR